ncbi:peptidyl-prolyl cis-trans isomerase NIMA-interacting 1 [Iris pallida]|uniref:Peptidyl-prolyl cis-trans isomerase NIMA-interacting 1 n=1 Tax=Iris pallida TaxID=29817 RepID=A0AAX6F157_IRIPA|nr:peptidyl-prolyl cis-trans isomerase NIMA-interacting 1 [Iris pallida]
MQLLARNIIKSCEIDPRFRMGQNLALKKLEPVQAFVSRCRIQLRLRLQQQIRKYYPQNPEREKIEHGSCRSYFQIMVVH